MGVEKSFHPRRRRIGACRDPNLPDRQKKLTGTHHMGDNNDLASLNLERARQPRENK